MPTWRAATGGGRPEYPEVHVMTGPRAGVGHWPGWAGQDQAGSARGSMRVYLGFAPGAGATCALLAEGHQLAERGTDVVVACVDTHGRPYPAGLLAGLPTLAGPAAELDLPAVLARAPRVALVDDLAQASPPGPAHPARWQQLDELLAAGIDVIGTVGLASLESLSDVVETITGGPPVRTVPDGVVRAADEVELIDVTPEVLRDRMARGEIYPPPQAQLALVGPFQAGNLSALRELALLWVAVKLAGDPQRCRPGAHGGRASPLPRARWALSPHAALALMVDRAREGGQLSRVAAAPVGEQPAGAAHRPRSR
jgi:K+-sensing histidine kinase KdpD